MSGLEAFVFLAAVVGGGCAFVLLLALLELIMLTALGAAEDAVRLAARLRRGLRRRRRPVGSSEWLGR